MKACPHCSKNPTSMSDYCRKHRPDRKKFRFSVRWTQTLEGVKNADELKDFISSFSDHNNGTASFVFTRFRRLAKKRRQPPQATIYGTITAKELDNLSMLVDDPEPNMTVLGAIYPEDQEE
jgi:hypothetical protein